MGRRNMCTTNSRILYHGSDKIILKPIYKGGKIYNDYGLGFYCTENADIGKEWACTEGRDGFLNQYTLDMNGLKILDLTRDDYHFLHWLTLLIIYRKFTYTTPIARKGAEYLKENYTIDLEEFDIIIGYRADDSYFSFAKAFLNNSISYQQLQTAMKLGKLGEQIVLKSEKAFQSIFYVDSQLVSHNIYYVKRKARDDAARKAYLKEIEEMDMKGLYIRDIIEKGLGVDDASL